MRPISPSILAYSAAGMLSVLGILAAITGQDVAVYGAAMMLAIVLAYGYAAQERRVAVTIKGGNMWTFCNCNECKRAAEQFAKKGTMPITQSRQFVRCDCGQLWLREPGLDEARDLLASAAALLKDKLTPDDGQLRTQWDRDVDEWLIAATPLFEEEQLQPLQSGCNSIAIDEEER